MNNYCRPPMSIAARRRIAEATVREVLIEARIKISEKLRAAGFTHTDIADVIGRDPSMVRQYLMPPEQRRRKPRVMIDD